MSLIPTKCRCGKSTMNFHKKIGDFYIDTCCQIAGYDHLGVLVRKVEDQPPVAPAAPVQENDPYASPELTTEDVTAEVKSPEEKKKRTYNRGGNVKA